MVGCRSRLQSNLSKWTEATAIVQESWNDETAKSFQGQYLADVEPVFKRMMNSLLDAVSLVQKIEKLVDDPDKFE